MKSWNHTDIDDLLADENKFNELVYTPVSEAISELKKRWADKKLEETVNKYLKNDIPEPLKDGFKTVLFRQLFTPNYEFRHFMDSTHSLNLQPMFLEYYDDKFTSNNPIKHGLGKLRFEANPHKDQSKAVRCFNSIIFNESDGKKIKDITTLWGQSLIDFHHELLGQVLPDYKKYIYDASDWFHRGGPHAKEYYARYVALFVRNGILMENFILEGGEKKFIKDIFLPAFFEIWQQTGMKPMILSLLPLESQSETFWESFPMETFDCVSKKSMRE